MNAVARRAVINSLADLHRAFALPPPAHPLISVIALNQLPPPSLLAGTSLFLALYGISFIQNEALGGAYGQQAYDFDASASSMQFCAPDQLVEVDAEAAPFGEGYMLVIHPDFLQGYELPKQLQEFGFFSYVKKEALHLSAAESDSMALHFQHIQQELTRQTDSCSDDILISYLELLLKYATRFYNRQFIRRKVDNGELLSKINTVLATYFSSNKLLEHGLPSVQWLAAQFHLSPNYLSDMLRANTGLTAKQHIQQQLLEKAKERLAVSTMTVAEIAYLLGFGYPQSFNKFFKSQTTLSPLEFRKNLATGS